MKRQKYLAAYLQRREDALLQVARKIARVTGIQGDTHQMSVHAIHCALLDKSTDLFEQGGDDTKFQHRLAAYSHQFGSLTPYHPDFAEALRARVLTWPLQEVELYMRELLDSNSLLCDSTGLNYLLDILRDATQISIRLERASLWVSQQKAAKPAYMPMLLAAEPQIRVFSIEEEMLDKIDNIAANIGLIELGKYILGARKKSALVGFHQALKEAGWISGTITERNGFFGNRYCVEILIDTYRGTKTGEYYYRETNRMVKQIGNVKL